MEKHFAYVDKERHDFTPWMRKKSSWRATCSCRRMLEKSGGFQLVLEKWKSHIQEEGQRREVSVFLHSFPA